MILSFKIYIKFNYTYLKIRGDYKCFPNDHIAYRYEILNFLGKGSFGSVVKVFDHKRFEFSEMKIIKNSKKYKQ